jgi:hypothetical protein
VVGCIYFVSGVYAAARFLFLAVSLATSKSMCRCMKSCSLSKPSSSISYSG